jgi:biotin carboxyl carrier protein
MDWYRIPKETGKSSWCEPYFDEGGAEVMMCTYSVPLMKRDGKVYAVLTADISLEDLTRHVAAIKPYADSYAVLFSQKGKPLVAAPAGAEAIKAPMPGNIIDVKVSQGQAVKKGDVLVILEAMKMENEIMAPRDGVVASVNVTKGATVNTGDVLLSLN